MIKKFEDYTNISFLVPNDDGSPSQVAKGPVGDVNGVKKFKEFAGEYRKGSDKFGGIVNDLMMYLRLFKDSSDKKELKFKIDEFQKKSNIDINRIKQLIESDYKLLSFDIKIDNEYITFTNLNNAYKARFVWGENKTNE